MRRFLLLGIAALVLIIGMTSSAAASNTTVSDATPTKGALGEEYTSYWVNFTDPTADDADGDSLLTWFNISDWNSTVVDNPAEYDDIVNISLWNATPDTPVHIAHNESFVGFPVNMNLTDYNVSDSGYANITVNITLNTTGLIDGKQIAFNATLNYTYNTTSGAWDTDNTNDSEAETIEVLDTTAGPSTSIAWEGNKNVLCANVTITPGNKTATQYLKKITFNNTATDPIDPAYIESFGLWNDTNANKTFDPTADKLINSSPPTEGSNVTFNLTDLSTDSRTIPATGGKFFLTMNITPVAHNGKYQAQVFAQNITINQTAGEGNTGNDTDTTGFTILTVDPVDYYIYDSPISPVSPGKSYVAYNITYQENTSDVGGANLTWLNITEMNQSVNNIGHIDDIINVTVYNETKGTPFGYVSYPNTFPIAINLSDEGVTDNTTYKLAVNLTVANDPWEKAIAVNATLYDNEANELTVNDPAAETIDYQEEDSPHTAVIDWNADTYYPDSTAVLSINDPDYNDNSSVNDTVIALMNTTTDTTPIHVRLNETGNNTGKFNGTVTFDASLESSDDTNNILDVADGDTIYGYFKDNQDQDSDTVTINDTASFEFTHNGSVDLNRTLYNTSNVAEITVTDLDENKDSSVKETINVAVNSTVNKTGSLENITVPLTENETNSGAFIGTFNFTTSGTSSGTTLRVNGSDTTMVQDTITVNYTDVKDTKGNTVYRTANATFNNTHTGVVKLNETVYKGGEVLNVTLYDPDLNYPAETTYVPSTGNYTLMLINTTNLTAYAQNPGNFDSENITNVTEYAGDTGWFMNDSIKLNTTNTIGVKDDGWINITPGDSFAVVYFDYLDEYGTNHSDSATRYVNESTSDDTASTLETASTSVWWNTSGNLTGNVLNVTSADVYGKDTVARISIDDADANADSSVNETGYVLVNSSSDANTINISVKETGPDTGIFNGTLNFGNSSDEASRVIGVNSSSSKLVNTRVGVKYKDTANVTGVPEWQNVTFTHWWTTNGTITWNDTTNYLTYYNTSVMKITVDDADRNFNTSAKESFNVTVTSWNATNSYDVNVTLNETTNKSGVFEGFLNFSETSSNYAVNKSTLQVGDNYKLNISYQDTNTSVGNTSMWINETNVSQYDKTRTGDVGLSNLNPFVGETVNVNVTDYDQNTNASTYQQVKVDVWSNTTGENGSITLTLNETSTDSTKFVGDLNFSTSTTNATLNQINVSDNDNITVEYVDPLDINGSQKTITNSSAWVTVHYTSEISLNESSYKPNQTAMVILDDEDLNVDPNIADTVSGVNISSDKYNKGFNITLKETGDDTGIFNRTISFTTSGSASPSDRIINVSIGGTVYANYTDTANATGDSETVSASADIEKTIADSLTLDRSYYNASQTVNVTIKDNELNDDSTLAEVYYDSQTPYSNVSVNSTTDQVGFNLSIEETGKDTGVFEGSFTLKPGGPTDTANKELNVSTGDTINVSYLNTQNVTGQQETMLKTATFDN